MNLYQILSVLTKLSSISLDCGQVENKIIQHFKDHTSFSIVAMLLIVFLWFFILSLSDGLSCIFMKSYHYIPKRDIDIHEIRANLDALPTNILINASACPLQMIVSSTSSSMTFAFSGMLFLDSFYYTHIFYRTNIEFDYITGQAAYASQLSYSCSQPDVCEKQFILQHTEWFSQANYIELQKAIRPLLLNKTQGKGKYIDQILHQDFALLNYRSMLQ